MKRILVTGASGLLGATVVKTLINSDYSVVAACRTLDSAPLVGDIQVITLDLLNEKDWASLPKNIDAVAHCAAYVPTRFNDAAMSDTLWRVNGLGTLKLLKWAKENGVAQFIYCSSHSIYRRPAPYPITEEHSVYPSGGTAYYAISKLAGEVFASCMRSDSFNVCSLRMPSLYGARMKKSGVLYHFVTQARAGKTIKIMSSLDSLFDFLYVQDAAYAIQLCLAKSPKQAYYNIGSGKAITLKELAEACWAIFAPHSPVSIFIEADETAPIYNVLDISRAQRELDYQPAFDIWTGLRDMKAHQEEKL
ncbi:NAD(P)-dependent oxidoreductase [Candidatus Bipolaricaulota bacterium]|nr:NAD(P)-dependent oxidoreductase [Candidatus Bipolaricaulota bacterium]